MAKRSPATAQSDPPVPDWGTLSLPDTWPDQLNLRSPVALWRLLRVIFGRRRPVLVPDSLPGLNVLPKYLLQEFHNLPNGNYSKKFTRGYITGFEHVMLGKMAGARRRIAQSLRHCQAVLDVGSAGGRTAGGLHAAGIPDVWGLDPSPYLLQHAARAFPAVRFVHGVAEQTGFADARFDGIAACFVLHEIPPRYLERCLSEFNRILKPGGLLAICEPSPLQAQISPWRLWRGEGFSALYFYCLARLVHEPFLAAWHQRDVSATLKAKGFTLISDEQDLPMRHVLARKC